MNPQYSDEYLSEYYSRYTVDEPEWDEPLLYGADFYLNLLEKYIGVKGTLLDIGAGKGHIIQAAILRGWNVSGFETDSRVAERLSTKFSIETQYGNFLKLNWRAGKFDAIILHHVLEHLKNPATYISKVYELIKDNGALMIILPNIGSFSSNIKLKLEKIGLRKKNVGAYYDTNHHLWYFTPVTLRRFLFNYGFYSCYLRSGHRVRPNQTRLRRFMMRNITERNLLHSTFLCIAKKMQI